MKSVTARSLLLLYHFDRKETCSIPFLSAKSLLAAEVREQRGRLDIADDIRRHYPSGEILKFKPEKGAKGTAVFSVDCSYRFLLELSEYAISLR